MFVFGYLCFQLEQFWAKRQSQSNINMSGEFNGCGFIRQHSVSDCEQVLPGEEGSITSILGQANAGSWLGTWVLFVSSYTTAIRDLKQRQRKIKMSLKNDFAFFQI